MHLPRVFYAATWLVAGSVVAACGTRTEPATLVLRNGKIVTVDQRHPEAQAMAARGDTIVAVGTNEEIAPYVGDATKVIDLGGRLAIPGFIEGHGHFTGIGDARLQLNLTTVKSYDEIVTMVADAVKKTSPGQLIRGRGWHQAKWDKVPTPNVEGVPLNSSLSVVSPGNPVVLTHASGHASFANAKALEVAGITRTTSNPPGGEIVKDGKGNPTGFLKETAQDLLDKVRALASEDEGLERRRVELASQESISKGITSFQDAGSSFATVDLLRKMVDEGKLPLRLWVMLNESNETLAANLDKYKTINYGDKRLTVRGIKRMSDGALGSHGAWLLEPYADLPQSTGLNTTSMQEIAETARLAIEHGYQLCVHAIGDRANREALNVFEATFKANPGRKDLRWRIEHAQHLHPTDIPRFGQLGVIASMQGVHCTSDAIFVPARLGPERAQEESYVWQSLLKTNAVVSNGTDAPVEDVNPIPSFYASVSRKLRDGTIFHPEHRMTREQALKSYTLSAAYAGFEDDIKGSIRVGKLADITVLSKDIMTIPEDEIPSTEVLYTIIGGQVAFSRASAQTE